MYQQLFINAPKEAYEYPYYTFADHFGGATGSFPPRLAMRNYIESRFLKWGTTDWIKFDTHVKNVTYSDETGKFTVITRNWSEAKEETETFDYVICATGHFTIPNMPEQNDYANYTGTLIHSHDQRTFDNYKDKTVMVIGTSYSADDIGAIAAKHGAKKVINAYRRAPMPWKFPDNFATHQLPIKKIDGKNITFSDDVTEEVDVIVSCTGYVLSYPFMEEKLRLVSPNILFTNDLYKGIFYIPNNKLMYLGAMQQFYSLTMFDLQSFYARDQILGDI